MEWPSHLGREREASDTDIWSKPGSQHPSGPRPLDTALDLSPANPQGSWELN